MPSDDHAFIEHDLKYWYIPRLIGSGNTKQAEELQDVEELMYEYASTLKQAFIVAASRGGHYPFLTSQGWLKFC